MIFFCSLLLYQEVMPRYDPEIRRFHFVFVFFLALFSFLDNFRLLLLLFLFLYCFVTPYNMERGLVCKLADSCLSIQWETKEEDKAYDVYGILDRKCHRILNDFSIFPFFVLFLFVSSLKHNKGRRRYRDNERLRLIAQRQKKTTDLWRWFW